MIALDTNVLARYLLRDHPQHTRARAILRAQREYWLPVTVILELAWVLKGAGATRSQVTEHLRAVLKLRTIRPQSPEAVYQALAWAEAEAGLDIADALHLALSQRADELLTFDAAFVQRAQAQTVRPPVRSA